MITVVIVGVGEWERYTKQAIDSIRAYEPDVRIVIVDNGDNYPYYYKGVNWFIKIDPVRSYAHAINVGVCALDSDYYIVLNNDILCNDKFVHLVEQHPINAIGANTINRRGGFDWIDGWHYCIPRQAWKSIGHFDENFKVAAFEDADYTIRARQLGFDIIQTNHPFSHLWTHNRYKVDKFWSEREANKAYLMQKHPEYKAVFDGYK